MDSATSESISNVSISVKGKKVGAISDASGAFKIKATSGDVLVFSLIGYQSQSVSVSAAKILAVQLAPFSNELNNVVVIGYGERKKKDVAGAISTVGARDIEKTTALTPEMAMKGQLAGVVVSSNSSDPAARVTVRIRGTSALPGGNGVADPLYVIDGTPIVEAAAGNWKGSSDPGNNGTFRTPVNIYTIINPDDIETISVLKDASASAIYGVRAANGVVLITTKKGKRGRARIDFDANFVSSKIVKTWDVLNTQQFVKFYTDAYNANPVISGGVPLAIGATNNTAWGPIWDPSSATYLGNSPTYNWQDAVMNKNPRNNQYNLRISGANETTNYSVSGGYAANDGPFIANTTERYTIASNITSKVNKYLEVGLNLRGSQLRIRNNSSSLGVANMRPWQPIYGNGFGGFAPSARIIGGGELLPTSSFAADLYGPNTKGNPLGNAAANETVRKNEGLIGDAYVQFEPIPGLKIKGSYNAQRYAVTEYFWNGFDAWQFSPTPPNPFSQVTGTPVPGTKPSYYQISTTSTNNVIKRLSTDYAHNFSGHSISATFIAEQTEYSGLTNLIGYTVNNPDPSLRFTDGTQQRGVNYNTVGNYALISYIGRLSYNFNSRYYVEGTVNRNASSRFAPGNQWGTFPAWAVGWRISQEKFMRSLTFINDLKLSGGAGTRGNEQTTGGWDYLSNPNPNPHYSLGNDPRGYGPIQSGVAYTSYPNFDLSWEKKKSINIGLDATLFKNALTLRVDWFRDVTEGIIQSVALPPSAGYQSSTNINVASVLNTGVEFTMGYNRTVGKVNLTFQGNFSTLHNEVLSVFNNVPDRGQGIEVGRPLGFIYGYKLGGIFQNQAEIDKWKTGNIDRIGTNAQKPGDLYFLDMFGAAIPGSNVKNPVKDGVINDQDQEYLGKSRPDYTYGFTLGASYQDFDISALFFGQGGNCLIQSGLRGFATMSDNGGQNNQSVIVLNAWTPTNTQTSLPRAVRGDPNSNNRGSDRWLVNGAFLRFQNLQIGYNVPKKILGYTKAIQSLRVFVSGINLFVISKYPGLDPENDNSGPTRQLQFGFKASF